MRRKFTILILALISAVVYAASPFQASLLKGEITIDGKLDEAAWQEAKTFNDFISIVNSRPELKWKPEFKVLQDGDNVYFGIKVNDDNLEQLRAQNKEYTSNPWTDDVVEIFLSPSGKYAEFYQLVFAAGGATWGAYYEEQGNIQPDPFGPMLDSALHKGDNFWSLEIRIPLRALYMTPIHQWKSDWLVNVCTGIKHDKRYELASWSKLKRGGFRDPKHFNTIGGMPVKTAQKHYNITDVTFKAQSFDKGVYNGELTLNATLAASGKYTLVMNGENKEPVELRSGIRKFKVPATFTKSGRNRTEFKLLNSKGEVVAERYYPVRVSFQPLSFTFDRPSYGNCFFPGQDASRIKGTINVKINADKVLFKGAGQEKELAVKDGKATFDFSLAKFPEKDFIVSAVHGEYKCDAHIRILSMPEKGHISWIDDGRFYLDGKPIVIRSFYGIAGLNNKGITYMCSNLMESQYKPASRKLNCQDFSAFWCSVQLLNMNKTVEAKEGIKDQKPSQEVYDWYKKRIEQAKDADFMCYYLSDEPECRGVSPTYLKYLYDYIKELDPYHPVFIISRSPVAYMECCDMMAPHPYNLPQVDIRGVRSYHRDFAQVNRMCAAAKNYGLKNKVLLICNQGYGSLGDNIYADFPNFDEVCADCWILFANGGMGLFPYIWYDHCTRPEMSKAFDFCYESAAVLEKYIVACGDESPMEISNPKVTARLTMPFGKPMLIMVNTSTEPEEVTLTAKDIKKAKKFYSFRQDVPFTHKKDTLTFKLKPLQWVVLTSEKLDDKLSTVNDAKENLRKIREQISARGSLLYGKIAKTIAISSSFGSELSMREILFNGWLEGRAWLPQFYKYYPQWIQLSFTDEVPKFSKIRLVGYNCGKAKFKYWKYGEWLDIEAQMTYDGKYEYTFDIGKTISTVKIKVEWDKQPEKLELYEYELLK